MDIWSMGELSIAEKQILNNLDKLRKHLDASLAQALTSKLSIDDVVQETFVKALIAYDAAQFTDDKMLLAWLKRIATNIAISAIRKKQPTHSIFSHGSSEIAQQLFASNDLTPSEFVSVDENCRLLTLALAKLEEHHQRVVKLRYHDQKSFDEIAVELHTTSSAARGLHRNALEKLRDHLGDMARYLSSR
jgi:RNA polymerase sigma factor (sigma-70 family)